MAVPDWVLRDCAEIPVAPDDPQLAVIAIAIYLEDALGVVVPDELLVREALGWRSDPAQTVRGLLGGD